MEYFIGVLLGVGVAGLAMGVGFHRDRSFGPTVLIVVAFYYVLFALIGGSERALVIESIVATAFVLLAAVGFKRNLWLVAAGLAGHGAFDLVHGTLINNPGVPSWWPGFCMTIDVLLGAWVAALLLGRSQPSLSGSFAPKKHV